MYLVLDPTCFTVRLGIPFATPEHVPICYTKQFQTLPCFFPSEIKMNYRKLWIDIRHCIVSLSVVVKVSDTATRDITVVTFATSVVLISPICLSSSDLSQMYLNIESWVSSWPLHLFDRTGLESISISILISDVSCWCSPSEVTPDVLKLASDRMSLISETEIKSFGGSISTSSLIGEMFKIGGFLSSSLCQTFSHAHAAWCMSAEL